MTEDSPSRSGIGRLGFADLPGLAATLGLGAAGGAVFAYYRLPLAWMLGAMFATTPLAVAGVGLRMDGRLRMLMIAVLGVMIGGAFSPAVLADARTWWKSILALVVFVAVVSLAVYFFFTRISRFDPRTAIFSCLPGGLSEMAVLGAAMGADDRMISLAHSVRIFIVVMSIPFIFQALGWYERGTSAANIVAFADMRAWEMVKIAAAAIAGLFVLRLLRFPTPVLIGPMLGSALVHVTGVATDQLPTVFVILAQIVIGSAIGARFANFARAEIWRGVRHAAAASVLMIAVTFAAAVALVPIIGFSLPPMILAFAPGGFAEMMLIALALNVDTAYVSTHHIFRVMLIVVVVPIMVRTLSRAGILGPYPSSLAGKDRDRDKEETP